VTYSYSYGTAVGGGMGDVPKHISFDKNQRTQFEINKISQL